MIDLCPTGRGGTPDGVGTVGARLMGARERLTRRLTMASALFLPATVVTAILGSNWAVSPVGGGWAGLGIVTGAAVAASAVFGLGVYIMQRRQLPRSIGDSSRAGRRRDVAQDAGLKQSRGGHG